MQAKYAYDWKGMMYPLRYRYDDLSGAEHYLPYMGIGAYHEVESTNEQLGTGETLNIGELEDIHGLRQVADLGGDRLDLIQTTHTMDLLVLWETKETLSILGLFSLPPTTQRRLEIGVSIMDYSIPYVDTAAMKKGERLTSGEQLHAVAAKNVSLHFDPLRSQGILSDWILTFRMGTTRQLGENVHIDSSFMVVVLSQFIARTYQASLRIRSDNRLPQAYLPEEDFIQLGMDVSISIKILF